MRSAIPFVIVAAMQCGGVAAWASETWTRPYEPARGIRVQSKSGRTTSIEVPANGPEAHIIIELRALPLIERRGGSALRAEWSLELDRQHARLGADLARIKREHASGRSPRITGAGNDVGRQYKIAFAGASAVVDRDSIPAIAALPYVKAVHPDRKMHARLQQSVPQIGAPQVWEQLGVRGRGVVVAIVDSGIDYMHPALGQGFGGEHRVIGGYDFVNDDADPMDDQGHGTHVAGIVAGNAAPVVGVAPEASLLAYKVLDGYGYGDDSAILAAVEKLLDPDGNGEFSDRADVVNLSLGRSSVIPDDPVVAAIERAVEAGVVFVIAAGNEGGNFTVGSPGVAPSVITVGASDAGDEVATFSSQGPVLEGWTIKPEVTAPGVEIVSAAMGGDTLTASGTSMATPHVAGLAALVRELHPDWSPADVKGAIVSTALPLTSVLAAGQGRVNAFAAATATLVPNPTTLSFGIGVPGTRVTRTLRLTNRGAGAQEVTLAPVGNVGAFQIVIEPNRVVVPTGETVEVTISATVGDFRPTPNDEGLALSGRIALTTASATAYVPWLLISGDLVAATYTGSDPAVVLLARDGYLMTAGLRTAVATTHSGRIDIVVVTVAEDEIPRVIVRENYAIDGLTVVTVPAEEASLELRLRGVTEKGIPLRTHGQMSNGAVWLTGMILQPPSGVRVAIGSDITFNSWRQRAADLLVSPMSSTRIEAWEGQIGAQYIREKEAYDYNAHLGTHRPLQGIQQHETLTFSPSDWATLQIDNPCATECEHSVVLVAGDEGVTSGAFGYSGMPGTVSLTKSEGGLAPWCFAMTFEDDHPVVGFTKGVSLISPSFHVDDDRRVTVRPSRRASSIDYSPRPGEPIAYGYGPPVLQTTLGMRWYADQAQGTDAWCITATPRGPIGEEYADDALRLQVTLYDESNNPNHGKRFVTDNFLLEKPLAPGKHRLEIVDQYRIADRQGRGTLIAQIDTQTNATAPTLTSLRVTDVLGRSVIDVPAYGDAVLQFSARQSTYFLGNLILHEPIDSGATRVWWRSHGSSEWQPLDVDVTNVDDEETLLAGGIGTVYRGGLRTITTRHRGAVDLRIALKNRSGATAEWTLEPAFFVTPPGRRRSVGSP